MASNDQHQEERSELVDSSLDVSIDDMSFVQNVHTPHENVVDLQKKATEQYLKIYQPSSGKRPEDEPKKEYAFHTGMDVTYPRKKMHRIKNDVERVPNQPQNLQYGTDLQETVHNASPPPSPEKELYIPPFDYRYQDTGTRKDAMVFSGNSNEYEKSLRRIEKLNLTTDEEREIAKSYLGKDGSYKWPLNTPSVDQMVKAGLKYKGLPIFVVLKLYVIYISGHSFI